MMGRSGRGYWYWYLTPNPPPLRAQIGADWRRRRVIQTNFAEG